MGSKFRVALVQNSAIDDLEFNLKQCEGFAKQAADRDADIICFPEYFACLEKNDKAYITNGYPQEEHPALVRLSELAKQLGKWFLLGSLPIKISADKVHNRSILLNPLGEVVKTYNKIHLFNVALKKGELYEESNTVTPGDLSAVCDLPWGILGLTICYDVRFPQLYRNLANQGADFISIPAAFTATTGRAHWHVLVRARAIENGCFIFAPGQSGKRPWGRKTFGHSLIVNPWGEVLADGGEEPGVIVAEIDRAQVDEARTMIPSLKHDRVFT